MRVLMIAAVCCLTACGKKTAEPATATPEPGAEAQAAASAAAPAEDPWPAGFPKPAVDYAGVYDFGVAGKTMEVKVAASGVRQRMALPPGAGPLNPTSKWSQVMVNDNASTMLMWPEGEGAPKVAMMMSRADLGSMANAFGMDEATKTRAVKAGADKVAGEACAIYEVSPAAEDETAGSACVTRDGIPLRVISGGQTVMLAKSIMRGAQDPALFSPPAGYEVVDMGECMRISAEMMAGMKSGKVPDMTTLGPKMEKCRVVGEKMGAMFGAQ